MKQPYTADDMDYIEIINLKLDLLETIKQLEIIKAKLKKLTGNSDLSN